MSSHGLRGLRHKSLGERRKAWRRKLKLATGLEWPTITQCRDQWRKLTREARKAKVAP